MTSAAGILFLSKDPAQVLYLKRGAGGDYPGYWAFPGGRFEAGETAEQTARREATEELGSYPKGDLREWTRTVTPVLPSAATEPARAEETGPVDFTTFLQRVGDTFEPKLNGEHVGFAWAPADQPPQPLHPGCAIALERLTMDELGIAKAMADGRLSSPQAYHNVTLFALRITGTGLAYRSGLKEYVWREPEHYLTDEFLQRCNGLSVIFEHPKKSLLNSKEFADRIVGSVMLAYIKGDEVWGIAKIYDAAAIKMMSDRQLSTSPAVTWSDLSVNMVLKQDDGSKLLIEGKPQLLDHVAICARGVWDKQGEPSGVLNDNLTRTMERTDMAGENEDKGGEDRKDADAGAKLDRLLTHMDAIHKRMDADKEEREKFSERLDAVCGRMDSFEARDRKDADEDEKKEEKKEEAKADARKDGDGDMSMADKAKADRAKADAEKDKEAAKADARKDGEKDEEEEKKERADAASTEEIWAAIRDVQAKQPKHLSDDDYSAFANAQARFDSVYQEFGQHAPRFLSGETLQGYRLRMAKDLQKHSPSWKDANLGVIAVDAASFDQVESLLFAEARRTANDPANLPEAGERVMVRRDSATGREVTEFKRTGSFVKDFMPPPQFVTEFNTAVRH